MSVFDGIDYGCSERFVLEIGEVLSVECIVNIGISG